MREDFFKVGENLFNINDIEQVYFGQIEKLIIHVKMKNHHWIKIEGLEAIDFMMIIKPSALEGRKLKYPKNIWIIHNLIAHPLMQILALLGFTKKAIWLHDITVPKPIGMK